MLCVRNAELLNVEECGTFCYHSGLKSQYQHGQYGIFKLHVLMAMPDEQLHCNNYYISAAGH